LRNGDEAVKLATRAAELTQEKDASILQTLAAASAEVGQFQKATRLAEKALAIAKAANGRDLAMEIETQLRLFQKRRPVWTLE
ncbi:MAG: tetratricopeptide repeat protein, partial [Limisphaerales bacterium]